MIANQISTIKILIAVLALCCVAQSHARAYGWFSNSTVSKFTDDDWKLFRKTVREALDNAENNTKLTWHNPATGHSGSVQPLNTFEKNDMICRKTRVFNKTTEDSATQVHVLCKQDGKWKVAP